jgi:hypothetical protein
MKHVFAIIITLLLSVPVMAQVAQQPQSTATVYVYRPHSNWGSLSKPFVYCDGSKLKRIDNGQYWSIELPAGQRQLTVGDYQIGQTVELVSGHSYYFAVAFHKSVMVKDRPMWSLGAVDNEKAQQSLAELTKAK